jgi:hypothetical protein
MLGLPQIVVLPYNLLAATSKTIAHQIQDSMTSGVMMAVQ